MESAKSQPSAQASNSAQIGAQMAKLRAQFGLSAQEVSERLHIRPRYILAIEEGKLEQLPGTVYARGYIHTYAEFLGMDVAAVLAQCFTTPPPNAAPVTPVAAMRAPTLTTATPWKGLLQRHWKRAGVVALVALIGLLLVVQLLHRRDEVRSDAASVGTVPEEMLESVRNRVMPNAANYECLARNTHLGCYNSDPAMRDLRRLERQFSLPADMRQAAQAEEGKPAEKGSGQSR